MYERNIKVLSEVSINTNQLFCHSYFSLDGCIDAIIKHSNFRLIIFSI